MAVRLAIVLSILSALVVTACGEDDPPVAPTSLPCFLSPDDLPEKTRWDFTLETVGLSTSGDEGDWVRSTGMISLTRDPFAVFITVSEPAIHVRGSCFLKVDSLAVGAADGRVFILNGPPKNRVDNHLFVTRLSDEGISATGALPVVEIGEPANEDTLIIDFDILTNICSPDPVVPDASRFSIIINGAATDTLMGTTATWDRDIKVIELANLGGSTEVGMTMLVDPPVVASGDTCALVLSQVTLTITKPFLTPPEVNVYRFPGEEPHSELLGIDFFTSAVISGRGDIIMQREDAFGWQEKALIEVDFDAFKTGLSSSVSR